MPGAFGGSSAEQTAKILDDVYDPILHLLRTVGVGGAGGVVSILDGADVTQGAKADVAVTGDSAGSHAAKLRGLLLILSDVYDAAAHQLKVSGGAGGGLTDAQLRASAVPVSVAGVATQATLAAIAAALDTTLSSRASDAGLAAILAELAQKTEPADAQHAIVDSSALPAGAATQVTLAALLAAVATEATHLLIKAKTDNIDVSLATRATEATLALIKAKTDNIDVLLSTRAVTGLTDAQLRASAVPVSGPLTDAQMRASVGPVAVAALDVLLSTRATEATLAAVLAALASVPVTGPITDAQIALRMGTASVDAPAAGTELERLRRIEVATQTNTTTLAKAIAKLPQAISAPVASMTTAFRGRV